MKDIDLIIKRRDELCQKKYPKHLSQVEDRNNLIISILMKEFNLNIDEAILLFKDKAAFFARYKNN